jgi:MFS family permease
MTLPLADGGWGWDYQQAGIPYTIGIVCFSIGVFTGGRLQDKIGPRWVCTIGGICVGMGLLLAGIIGANPIGIAVCFGVISCIGIGFGYSSVLPTALKWFHSSQKGLVSGFVTGGFCLAAVYLAPMATAFLNRFSIEQSLMLLGTVSIVTSTIIAQFVKLPANGYVAMIPSKISEETCVSKLSVDYTSGEMVKTKRFYLMFFVFLINVSIGLMIIGNIASIAYYQARVFDYRILAFLLAFMAIINFFGRVGGGFISDKIGRTNTLFIVMAVQMLNMAAFRFYDTLPFVMFGALLAGTCFGAVLSIFPAFTADQFGIKNHGANYGVVYLAYGASGVVAPLIADYIYDNYSTYSIAYIVCAFMMMFALLINFVLKREVNQIEDACLKAERLS